MAHSIIADIAVSIRDYLETILKDDLASEDATRAGLVRIGLLQSSPTQIPNGVSVLINFNDPDDEKAWYHSIVSGPGDNLGLSIPAREVGGGEMWFRRYTLNINQFFKAGATRVNAETFAQVILSRVEEGIRHAPLPQDEDSFGEIALRSFIHSSQNIEGGGNGQFIYRGKIWFQVLTEKSRM